jgi:hypothetical protein
LRSGCGAGAEDNGQGQGREPGYNFMGHIFSVSLQVESV